MNATVYMSQTRAMADAYEAGKRAYYEGAWPVPYEHKGNADAWYRGHAEASIEANDHARRSGSLLKKEDGK